MNSFTGLSTLDSNNLIDEDLAQQKASIMLGAILIVERMVKDESSYFVQPRILQMTENMKKDL